MSDDQPSLQIDTDWKKQAQEEKRKLAERTQQQAAPAAPGSGAAAAGATAAPAGGAPAAAPAGREGRGRRELPQASMSSLVNSLLTQVLLYLGEVATAAGPMVDLDRARHHLDTMAMLEEKTKNNLTEDEQKQLDSALYEARMRFVNVASQYL
jgi:hypothetical protein